MKKRSPGKRKSQPNNRQPSKAQNVDAPLHEQATQGLSVQGFGHLLISPEAQKQPCRELFGADLWVLENANRQMMASKHSKGPFHTLFVRKQDADAYGRTCGRTANRICWDEVFEVCTFDGQLAIEVCGPKAVLQPFQSITYFLGSEVYPDTSSVRREHIQYGLEQLVKARCLHPNADLSIWTPLSVCCALDNELPADYQVRLAVPTLFMIAHPFTTCRHVQWFHLIRQDEHGQLWTCRSDGSERTIDEEDNWVRQCVAWMNSPCAVVERVGAKHKTRNGRRYESCPEYVVVQKRSRKYIGRQTVVDPDTEHGSHSNPRFEFEVQSHVRRQPYPSFGRDEGGNWICVKDIIIRAQTRCKGKERPIVVSAVTR